MAKEESAINVTPEEETELIGIKRGDENRSTRSKITLFWHEIEVNISTTLLPSFCFGSNRYNDDLKRSGMKTILCNQSGQLSSGELVAIIGPSGAGKSTLLKSLSGRKTRGISGEIFVNCDESISKRQLSLAYMDQRDSLLNRLTVKESLMFASRIKYGRYFGNQSKLEAICDQIIQQFKLESCKDTLAVKCSGGQRRRLSIGLELINAPKILLLDEPTSGLDSSSALQCVQLMKQLAEKQNLAIIVSLHQPSAAIINLFHRIYVLSHDGRLLFHDNVKQLQPRLNDIGYPCPPLHNIADHVIELASGSHGKEAINKLAERVNDVKDIHSEGYISVCDVENERRVSVEKITERMQNQHRSKFFYHIYVLVLRTLLISIREPWLNVLRFIGHLVVGLIICALYSPAVGQANGCVLKYDRKEGSLLDYVSNMQTEAGLVSDNMSQYFFSLLFLVFAALMTTVMTFPFEMSVLIKERSNGCYSCLSYYLARSLADVPFTILNVLIYINTTYFITGQIMDADRYVTILFVYVLMQFVGQSTGLLCGAIFVKNPDQAMFMAPASMIPLFLLSGFFVKIESMPSFLKPVTYLTYWRYGFEAIIIAVYGQNRCSFNGTMDDATDSGSLSECSLITRLIGVMNKAEIGVESIKSWAGVYFMSNPELSNELDGIINDFQQMESLVMNQTSVNSTTAVFYQNSFIMKQFKLTDERLYEDILALIGFVILFRIAAYFALYYKASHKK